SPAKHTNVLSSDCVGVTNAVTRHTTEAGLIGAVRLVRMSTHRTAARCVTGINQHNGNARPLCFVADKGTKLGERPTIQLSALLPSSPHPRANTLEVFKADRPLCAFGSLNNAFADRVVDIFGEAALLTSKLAESSSRRFGAQLLEFGSQPPMPIPHVVHMATAVDGSIRVAGDVGHTQVNPKHVVNVLGGGFFHRTCHEQIPFAAMEEQIAFPLACLEHRSLAFSANKRVWLPSLKRPDRDG